jgi:hypothetical protein
MRLRLEEAQAQAPLRAASGTTRPDFGETRRRGAV